MHLWKTDTSETPGRASKSKNKPIPAPSDLFPFFPGMSTASHVASAAPSAVGSHCNKPDDPHSPGAQMTCQMCGAIRARVFSVSSRPRGETLFYPNWVNLKHIEVEFKSPKGRNTAVVNKRRPLAMCVDRRRPDKRFFLKDWIRQSWRVAKGFSFT